MSAPTQSFDGLDKANWGAGFPPSSVGDVGPTLFVQAVNASFAVFTKTGNRLAAATFNTLWSGAGTATPCDNLHQGSPVVLYDAIADRWIVADLAFLVPQFTPPYYVCVADSKTGDPVGGGWWLHAIRADDAADATAVASR
jgi:hypothetical protein